VPTVAVMRSWVKMDPDYSGRVGKFVKDLGVGFSVVGVRGPDRGDRVDKADCGCYEELGQDGSRLQWKGWQVC